MLRYTLFTFAVRPILAGGTKKCRKIILNLQVGPPQEIQAAILGAIPGPPGHFWWAQKVQLVSPDVRFNVWSCPTIVQAIWECLDLLTQPGFWRSGMMFVQNFKPLDFQANINELGVFFGPLFSFFGRGVHCAGLHLLTRSLGIKKLPNKQRFPKHFLYIVA